MRPRIEKLREKLSEKNLDAFLISSTQNRYYLTSWAGDSESGFLLITKEKAFIFSDSRYTEEIGARVKNFELIEYKGGFTDFLKEFLEKEKLNKLGFESHDLSVFTFQQLRKKLKGIKLIPAAHAIETLREFKDQEEIKLIKKAVSIAADSFDYLRKNVTVGQTEIEIARKLESFMKEKGAEKNAWDNFIVAAGSNSSMVHYAAGKRKIKKGDQVLIDWGCVYQGYHCDISRVIFMGEPNSKQREVYNLVLEAQKRGIEKIRVGRPTSVVDKAAREFLESKSDFAFGHSVGHGVGLEVHELPRVNSVSKTKLAAGQVITVEPGIYEPGWGGVRIEDMVLVTEAGGVVLTELPKNLDQIIVD